MVVNKKLLVLFKDDKKLKEWIINHPNYFFLTIFVIIFMVMALLLGYFVDSLEWDLTKDGNKIVEFVGFQQGKISWVWLVFWFELICLVLSLRSIGPTNRGCILIFGKPTWNVDHGLNIVPLIVCSLLEVTRISREKEYPDPERLWTGEGDPPPDSNKISPIRVIQGRGDIKIPDELLAQTPFLSGKNKLRNESPAKKQFDSLLDKLKEVGDPLHQRMATEVSAIIITRITDVVSFISNLGSLEELDKRIEDVVIAHLRSILACISPSMTLLFWVKIEKSLKAEVEKTIEGWGVEILTVRMKEVDVGRTVNKALRNAVAAGANKQTTIIDAEATQAKKTKEGIGAALAQLAMLKAQGMGYNHIATSLGIEEKQVVLLAEIAEKITSNADYAIFGGEGCADLMSLVSKITKTVDKFHGSVTSKSQGSQEQQVEGGI